MERRKREEERRKAVALLSKKSPKSHHLTIEQRHYQMKIKELRAKSERRSNNNNSDPETDSSAPEEKDREREPRLTNITSEYDLKLFQEALAVASEKIVICASFSVYYLYYPLSYRVPIRERYGSTLLPATREQHDQNCTQSH